MIKKLILSIIIISTAISSYADNRASSPADSAYNEKNYVEAIKLYQAEIDSIGPTSDLYYNIANCYYRLGKQGKAVVGYERALRMNPRNNDASTNLDFINSRLVDRPGERGTFLGNIYDTVTNYARSDTWAWIALISFVLTAAGALLYFFTSDVMLRKTGFFGGGVMLIVCVITIFLSINAADIQTSRDKAVVIVPSTILSTAPRTPSNAEEEAMMLHEGALLKILDSVNVSDDGKTGVQWLEVEFDNTHRAWINASDTEVI